MHRLTCVRNCGIVGCTHTHTLCLLTLWCACAQKLKCATLSCGCNAKVQRYPAFCDTIFQAYGAATHLSHPLPLVVFFPLLNMALDLCDHRFQVATTRTLDHKWHPRARREGRGPGDAAHRPFPQGASGVMIRVAIAHFDFFWAISAMYNISGVKCASCQNSRAQNIHTMYYGHSLHIALSAENWLGNIHD